MTVWLVWEGSHEEIAVVCATEAIARQWVSGKVAETRAWYVEERDRRIAAKAELGAMPMKEQLRIMGMRGYGEPTLSERLRYFMLNADFYKPEMVTEEQWPVEEAQVIEELPHGQG